MSRKRDEKPGEVIMSRLKELRKVVDAELNKMESPDKRIGAVNHGSGTGCDGRDDARPGGL